MHKSHISSVLQFFQYGSIAFFFITISATLRSELSFAENIIMPLALLERYYLWNYWIYTQHLGKRKRNQSLPSSEQLLIEFRNNINDIYKFLSIPDYAEEIDILSFTYTTKNGKVKLVKNTLPVYQFSNCIFKIYSDTNNLYLTCLKGTYAFPLSSLTAIQIIKKEFALWNGIKKFLTTKGFISNFTYHLIIMVAFTVTAIIFQNQRIAEFPTEFIFPAMTFNS